MARDLTIPACDGRSLAATLHEPEKPPRSLVVINSATAVKRGYYHDFAQFLAQRGHLALTYDYRGIGGSRPAPRARMLDWGAKDFAGVLAWARKEHANLMLAGVGHSFGGQALALAEGTQHLKSFIGIAAQSGYYGHWPRPLRYRRWIDWHVLIPAVAIAFGRVPGWTGLGEDLPKGVALEWARWGRSPDYLLREDVEARREAFRRFGGRMLSLSIEGDNYAPPDAVDWLARQFENANVERRHLSDPGIGHFSVFRPRFQEPVWLPLAEWLEGALLC